MEEVFGTFWRDVLGDDDDDDDDDDDGAACESSDRRARARRDATRGAGSEGEAPGD